VWNLETVMQMLHTTVWSMIPSELLHRAICSQYPSTVQEMIANKMNDPTFNPTSLVDVELHDSFSEPTDLSKDVCMNVNVTTKDKIADAKVKLYKIIYQYKLCSNGEGNLIDEDADWVTREATDPNFGNWDRKMYKDDNRKDFLIAFGEVFFLCMEDS